MINGDQPTTNVFTVKATAFGSKQKNWFVKFFTWQLQSKNDCPMMPESKFICSFSYFG